MKIKLAILEKEASYLRKITSVFETKYADKFQIYSFSDANIAFSTLDQAKIDILVASDVYDIDLSRLPKRCGFAYFVDSPDVETVNGQGTICKFQKVDLIYKQILSIYSETAGRISGLKFDNNTCKLLMFQSVSGGAGASSMAAACAVNFASKGKRVLYLNLETFGASDVFFNAPGQFDMSDIIFALKSKKANLAIKLESCVKQAENGVYFYSQPKIALDMLEFNSEDMTRLVSELCLTGSYDYIVVDSDFSISQDMIKLQRRSHALIWVCEGSEISNIKMLRAFNALNTLEQNADMPITNRLLSIYNKFSNKTCTVLDDIGIKNIGGAPRYEHATTAQVVEQLAKMNIFDRLM